MKRVLSGSPVSDRPDLRQGVTSVTPNGANTAVVSAGLTGSPTRACLPEELVKHIFSWLDERGLCRVQQVCRKWSWLAPQIVLGPLDWESQASKQQRTASRTSLAAEVARWPTSTGEDNKQCPAMVFNHLKQSGSRYRHLAVDMPAALQATIMGALAEAERWQRVELRFPPTINPKGFLRSLDISLWAKGRSGQVDLVLDTREAVEIPDLSLKHGGVVLTGLQWLDDFDYDDLKPIGELLRQDNSLERCGVSGEGRADVMYQWLKQGSKRLRHLELYDMPNQRELVCDVLKSKTALNSLQLCEFEFYVEGLTFPAVLNAVPGLECLDLRGVAFEVGASQGCKAALTQSRLRQLTLSEIILNVPAHLTLQSLDMRMDALRGLHSELLDGVRMAPCLMLLELFQLEWENPVLRSSMTVLVQAFADNPCARILRAGQGDEEVLRNILAVENKKRRHRAMPEIQFEARPEIYRVQPFPLRVGDHVYNDSGEDSGDSQTTQD